MPTWKGPFSDDDGFENFTKGLSRDASYPSRTPNKYTVGPPSGSRHDFNAIDCSWIDGQTPDKQGFDDGKGSGGYLKTKSDDARGGASGDLLPRGRAGNHPKKGTGV